MLHFEAWERIFTCHLYTSAFTLITVTNRPMQSNLALKIIKA